MLTRKLEFCFHRQLCMYVLNLDRPIYVLNFVANGRAKLGKPANLENWMFSLVPLTAGDSAFGVNLEWDEQIGVPGAILVKNNHETEFFLKSVILEDVPGVGRMHFVCNSWIYPARRYKRDRVFFINKVLNDRFDRH